MTTDAPERIWLRWDPGAAVTQGPLTTHPEYTEWVRADVYAGALAENERLRLGLECVYQYGFDTLMGPSQGVPDDRKWQRDGVMIMTRRARATLEGASQDEILAIRAEFAAPPPITWATDPDAIVEDDEPQIGRDYA